MAKDISATQKLLWIDLEMTGLDPATQRIIEVAAVVTDYQLNELGSYEAIINQSDSTLDNAEDFPKEAFGKSGGLFEQVAASDKSESDVESELLAFINQHFAEPAILAGNSIHQDRRFIRQWWPCVEGQLHYRMLDVSSWKVWRQGLGQPIYGKKESHRALEDIRESILELRMYTGAES